MKRAFLVLAFATSLNVSPSVLAQDRDQPLWIAQVGAPPGFPIQAPPPEKPQHIPTDPREIAPQAQSKKKFDAAEAQRNAQEMAALAQKIPAEVEQASKNVLSKDLIQQLKQIEKLAKRLRTQLSR
jgi:hypothetical protein